MQKVEEILKIYHLVFLFCLSIALIFLFLAIFLFIRICMLKRFERNGNKCTKKVMRREKRRWKHDKET